MKSPALALLLLACGARSALEEDGGGGGPSTSSSGSTSGSTGSGGAPPCVARRFDVGGPGAHALKVVGNTAYAATVDGRILAADLESGEATVLVEGAGSLGDLVVLDGFVIYSDVNAIWRVPTVGGAPEVVVELLMGPAYSMAVEPGGLYWIEGPGSIAPHSVFRLGPSGVEALVTNVQYPAGLALGTRGVVFTDQYATLGEHSAVNVVDREGGPAEELSNVSLGPKLPFEIGGYDYWVEEHDEDISNHGGIARVPVEGGQREKVLSLEQMFPITATADGERYFLTVLREQQAGSALITSSFPLAGSPTVVVASEPEEFFTAVATNTKFVVWTVQQYPGSEVGVDGIQTLCKADLP